LLVDKYFQRERELEPAKAKHCSNSTHIYWYNRSRANWCHWTPLLVLDKYMYRITSATSMVALSLTHKMVRQKHAKRTLYSTEWCDKLRRKVITTIGAEECKMITKCVP
jgi:hypothetical protein